MENVNKINFELKDTIELMNSYGRIFKTTRDKS